MSKRTKWSVAGVFVLAIAGVAALTAARSGTKAASVRIEAVQRRDLVASVTASGQVRPRTKVDLSSDITGKIVRLAVQEGVRHVGAVEGGGAGTEGRGREGVCLWAAGDGEGAGGEERDPGGAGLSEGSGV